MPGAKGLAKSLASWGLQTLANIHPSQGPTGSAVGPFAKARDTP